MMVGSGDSIRTIRQPVDGNGHNAANKEMGVAASKECEGFVGERPRQEYYAAIAI